MATLRPGDTAPEQFEDDLDSMMHRVEMLEAANSHLHIKLSAAEVAIGAMLRREEKLMELIHDFMLELSGSRLYELYEGARELHQEVKLTMNPYSP